MSAWSWLTRLVLGADKEAEEKAAQDRFAETMNGSSEPPMSPDELEAKLDAIVARVETETGALISINPLRPIKEDDEQRRQRDTRPDTGRQPEGSGAEDAVRRDSSSGLSRPG